MTPETRYAKSGEVHIAYQVVGDGPVDLVFIPGLFTHVEHQWDEPTFARFLGRLASFSRLIVFDARGAGPLIRHELPPMEDRIDDLLAVLDAIGSSSAAIFGMSQAGPMAILFAASYPERTRAIVLYGSLRVTQAARRISLGAEPRMDGRLRSADRRRVGDRHLPPKWRPRASRTSRSGAGGASTSGSRMGRQRARLLPHERADRRSGDPADDQVPTLVLHRRDDIYRDIGHARYLAEHIPGAKLVELQGSITAYFGDADSILDEVEEFLTGVRPPPERDRVLATVLFTDIVGSTSREPAR